MAKDFKPNRSGMRALETSPEVLRVVRDHFGEAILADAKAKAPVKTGELRGSGYAEIEGDHVEVGFTAEHAPFVELGTVDMSPRPFLRPAAFAVRPGVG